MNESLEALRGEVLDRIQQSNSEMEIEQLRVEVLGRKGKLTLLLRGLADLPAEERPQAGQELNQLRRVVKEHLDERLKVIKEQSKERALEEEKIDITLPGTRWERGRAHPLTLVLDEIIDVFWGMGFEIARGPDIEDDYHNFEALNIPKDHPARDMQDTFFVSNDRVLRTHTSPVQIRTMEARKPPLQVIVPGAVYRHDDDATHSPMFHQVEGFMVDRQISFADLRGVLTIEMEIVMPIQFDGFGYDAPLEIINVIPASTDREIGIRAIDCSDEGRIAAKTHGRVAGQAVIVKGFCVSLIVDLRKDGAGAADINRQAGAGSDDDLGFRLHEDFAGNI